MTSVNLAKRAHDHNYDFDPIIRSLLDTDFYKLLMAQFIWKEYPNVHVSFALKNRTTRIKLANIIPIEELKAQLDHVKTLRFRPNELIWLAGATFYGQDRIFEPGFIEFLRGLRMPDYFIDVRDGQYVLTFSGKWPEVTFWEIYALAIISELKFRSALKKRNETELEILFANATSKLFKKLCRLKKAGVKGVSEFGTRRRASFLWQEKVALMMRDFLGDGFVGTSNAYLAFKHGMDAKGTNAHELPMVLAALTRTPEDLKQSQYEVLRKWQKVYGGNLLVCLPDTFGSTQFFKNAPAWVSMNWKGYRPDSKKPFEAGDEIIDFLENNCVNPLDKFSLFSDGLDVEIAGYTPNGSDIIEIDEYFKDRIGTAYGWGTNATNDFRECDPREEDIFDPISVVCKVETADGVWAVKLSDNYEKASGPAERIEYYRENFGTEGVANVPCLV